MRELLQLSPLAFLFVKLILINLAIGYLWLARKRKLIHILIIPVIIVYIYAFALHCETAYKVFLN